MKKIVMTGGGTAGHVTPNIALFPALQKEGYEISYIGSYEGIEKRLIEEQGVPYYGISSGKLRRYFDPKNFSDPFKVLKGYHQSVRLLKKLKPDVVFSKGGFVSVPVVLAASRCHIPAIIHESDLTPGLANRIAIPKATKVCCNFPETLAHVPEEKAVAAIRTYAPPAMRQQIKEAHGITLIDDTYNASPDSMRSALDVLMTVRASGQRVAVLADMLELGEDARQGHWEVGRYAREKGVDRLLGIGPLSKDIVAGYGSEKAEWFASNQEAAARLRELLQAGDAVLVNANVLHRNEAFEGARGVCVQTHMFDRSLVAAAELVVIVVAPDAQRAVLQQRQRVVVARAHAACPGDILQQARLGDEVLFRAGDLAVGVVAPGVDAAVL